MRSLLLGLIMLLAFASSSGATTLLFESGTPNGMNGLSIVGDPPNEVASAAQFTTSVAWRIESVKFWSLEQGGFIWDGTIEYFFLQDVFGIPDSVPLIQGNAVNIAQIPDSAGACCSSTSSFRYTFDLVMPIALGANTQYWLALQIGRGNLFGQTFWSTTDLTPITATAYSLGATFDNWILTPQSGGLAFQLFGEPVPEPSTALLLTSGLAVLIGWRRTVWRLCRRRR